MTDDELEGMLSDALSLHWCVTGGDMPPPRVDLRPGFLESRLCSPWVDTWLLDWANCDFPRVIVEATLATTLVHTGSSDPTEAGQPELPWPVALIDFTEPVLSLGGALRSEDQLDHILVRRAERGSKNSPGWTLIATTAEAMVVWFAADLLQADCTEQRQAGSGAGFCQLANRLVAGVCRQLSTPDQRKRARLKGPARAFAQRSDSPKDVTTYVLDALDWDTEAFIRFYARRASHQAP